MNGPTTAAIGIPAYDAEDTIGETLEAVQRNPALARIAFVAVLDDCSSDRTIEIARSLWKSRVPLEIWRNPENMGQWRTTNALMARAADRVAWTFVLHADDVVKPTWLSLYLDALPGLPPSVATVCSSFDNWWPEDGRIEAGEEFPDKPAAHVTGDRAAVVDTLRKGGWWHLSGCAIRNEAFRQIGGFEPELPHVGDWEWLLRCLAKGYGVWYLPRSTSLYRQHERSISSQSFRASNDIREKLQVFGMMRSQGYLGNDEYDRQVRSLLRQTVRRTAARAIRRDWRSFRSHSAMLRDVTLSYLLKRL